MAILNELILLISNDDVLISKYIIKVFPGQITNIKNDATTFQKSVCYQHFDINNEGVLSFRNVHFICCEGEVEYSVYDTPLASHIFMQTHC